MDSPEPLPTHPYGAWPSPIRAEDLVVGFPAPLDTWAEDGVTWYSRSRPDQGGRVQVLRLAADGTTTEPLPPTWNARTSVHEYGGGAWWVHRGVVFAVSWEDQRLYRCEPGAAPVALTPEPASPRALRYADGRVTPDGAHVICVRESHGADVRNELVVIDAVPADPSNPAEPRVLVTGPDFVAAPRISPDGTRLAWIEWQHPDMPWTTTRLWTGSLVDDGDGPDLGDAVRLPSGVGESLVQPEWGPDGTLYVVSDRTDWWNVFRVVDGDLLPVHPVEAEVGIPAWVFGQSRYQPTADGVWITWNDPDGSARLLFTSPEGDVLRTVPYVDLQALGADGDRLVAIGSRAAASVALVEFAREDDDPAGRVLNRPPRLQLPTGAISVAERITFPSAGGREAHALLFRPASATVRGPEGERPPLIVSVHGGPTGRAQDWFRKPVQFWTSRGFAYLDVDHGGSTGYGRPYRRLLDGAWGVVDVEDACAGAEWVAAQGLADADRLVIRGGSAGGFTVLAALATRDTFAAGADHYGVADLAALARDTHKFESRYLDGLVGPWPEAADVYAERSPLSHVDGFDRPLIVLQGDQDAVVPPSQSEMIVKALADKGVPHAYLLFEGEQHGFRKSENIVRALEAELSFYAEVFGLPFEEGQSSVIS